MTTIQPHDLIDQQAREQLSALLDNELDGDAARFLQRRLQHDDAMAAQLVRWQVAGDVLRAQARTLQPGEDLAVRVRAAIEREQAETSTPQQAQATPARRGAAWLWGGGLATAAVLALAALSLPATRGSRSPASVPTEMARAPTTAPDAMDSHAQSVAASTNSPDPDATASSARDPQPAAGNRPVDAPLTTVASSARVANASPDADSESRATVPAQAQRAVADTGASSSATRRVASTHAQSNSAGEAARDVAATVSAAAARTALPEAGMVAKVSAPSSAPVNAKAATRANPFIVPDEAPALPWPKAALPGFGTGMNASFGQSATANPFGAPAVPQPALEGGARP